MGHPGPVNGGRPHLSPGVLQPGPVRSPAAVPENRREGVDASGEPPQGSRGWRVIQRLVGIAGEVPDGSSEPGRVRGYVGSMPGYQKPGTWSWMAPNVGPGARKTPGNRANILRGYPCLPLSVFRVC